MSSSQGQPIVSSWKPPKYVVLCQHGYKGNASSLSGIVNRADNEEYFSLDNYVAKYNQDIVTFATALKDLEESLASQNKTLENKVLFIRTEFSNKTDDVKNQSNELNIIVDHVKLIYPYNTKIILLGHSKGGLVGVEYASRYTNKVAGLISIATPYNYQILLNGISGDGTLMWPWKMLEIRDQWNQLSNKPKAFALASGAFVARTIPVYYMGRVYNHPVEWSDPYVELSHAMAKGYNNIKAYQIAYQGNTAYEHSGMVDQLFTYHRVLACINQVESE